MFGDLVIWYLNNITKTLVFFRQNDKIINAAPANIDNQEIPRSALELMKYRDNPSLMKMKRKKRRGQYNPSKGMPYLFAFLVIHKKNIYLEKP